MLEQLFSKLGPISWGDLLQIFAFLGMIIKLHVSNRERVVRLEIRAGNVEQKIDEIKEDVKDLTHHLLGKH